LLIEQLHYTTTPKYNFPQPFKDIRLPQRFIELSLKSMKKIDGEYFQPHETTSYEFTKENFQDATPTFLHRQSPTPRPIPLKPISDDTTIIGIDVSSINVGETQTGVLCAVRGAIAWNGKNRYRCLHLGPFPFHVTEENKKEIYHMLKQRYFKVSEETNNPSLINMPMRICNLLERWIQMGVSCSSHRSIILWDGSLTAGTNDSPVNFVSQLLEMARDRLNTVLAFSKMTRLRISGHLLTDLIWKYPPPCLLRISNVPIHASSPMRFLGNIYVAKLTGGSCSFRLDIDKGIQHEKGVEAVQRLLGNDLLSQSYPETLRLAHVFSTFTANEVIGIQRFITQEYGLKIVTRPNVRRLLFGSFGKGAEG
jgi:hypothetical protein